MGYLPSVWQVRPRAALASLNYLIIAAPQLSYARASKPLDADTLSLPPAAA